jgi:hypothetical protein
MIFLKIRNDADNRKEHRGSFYILRKSGIGGVSGIPLTPDPDHIAILYIRRG